MMRRLLSLTVFVFLAACGKPEPASTPDATYSIDRDRISVSGISAGAYMAGQMHVAHSSLIKGAGLIAGGPYWCAQNSLNSALEICIQEGAPDLEPLAAAISEFAEAGSIDAPSNLAGSPVWLFRSPIDPLVGQALLEATADQYRSLGADVSVVNDLEAAHGVPTLATGPDCTTFEPPYLNACEYDAAGAILSKIHGSLEPRGAASGEVLSVPVPGAADASLLDEAFLYVPGSCSDGESCGIHIFFHGCMQSSELLGDAVVRGAGLNEWAETNRLLVLYPQVKASKLMPLNPRGCFDWWGYTDDNYASKTGAQIVATMALIETLAGETL